MIHSGLIEQAAGRARLILILSNFVHRRIPVSPAHTQPTAHRQRAAVRWEGRRRECLGLRSLNLQTLGFKCKLAFVSTWEVYCLRHQLINCLESCSCCFKIFSLPTAAKRKLVNYTPICMIVPQRGGCREKTTRI